MAQATAAERPATEPRRGRIVAAAGAVVDVDFGDAGAPPIRSALEVEWDGPHRLTLEVQAHLDPATARCVALQETAGLRPGTPVRDSGGPLTAPTGRALLGRMIDVAGDPIDGGPPLPADLPRMPIHRPPPPLASRGRRANPS